MQFLSIKNVSRAQGCCESHALDLLKHGQIFWKGSEMRILLHQFFNLPRATLEFQSV